MTDQEPQGRRITIRLPKLRIIVRIDRKPKTDPKDGAR